jgi:hypothetical protein
MWTKRYKNLEVNAALVVAALVVAALVVDGPSLWLSRPQTN